MMDSDAYSQSPTVAAAPTACVDKATPLQSLPLPPSSLVLLSRAEFMTVGDLDGLTAAELAEELSIDVSQPPVTPAHAAKLLLMARSGGMGESSSSSCSGPRALATTALALLEEERAPHRRIITFARELDELLGGGVPLRQVTELAGAPGVGKTQLGMQLALNVQLPAAFGGLSGRAVYIDTEGSFLAPRIEAMAKALIARLRAAAASEAQARAAHALDPHAMLEGISVYRVHDAQEQLAVLRALDSESPPAGDGGAPLRLLVVDSIAFHLRHADMSYTRRTQVLGEMAQRLHSLAARTAAEGGPLASVCLNQMTTKVNDAAGSSSLVPALGEVWAHVCNVQLTLMWRDGVRLAHLYKGRSPGEAAYAVTEEGIRSIDVPPLPPPPPPHHHHHHQHYQQHQQHYQQHPQYSQGPMSASRFSADENRSAQQPCQARDAPGGSAPGVSQLGKRRGVNLAASAMPPPPVRHATPTQPYQQYPPQ